ncbi:MAG: DNA polymerase III subunit delta [Bacteroidales bacterium]
MAKKEQHTIQQILADIHKRKFAPIYFLMGEEPFFIDKITEALLEKVLTPEEKDFNLTVMYGGDTEVGTVISAARRYPMMSEYQLVILKEAQLLDQFDLLENYTKQPVSSTVFVINYKHKNFDSRKKLMKDIAQVGIIFESKKIYDNKVPEFVMNYVSGKGLSIDGKAALMMADYIGTDLNRLCSELDKLCISPDTKEKKITPAIIERNIGISKDFNNFELLKAVISRDIYKANQIQLYFSKNTKENPIMVTLSVLFNFFSNLMLAYYSPDKTEGGLMKELGLKSTYAAKDYIVAMRQYNAFKTMDIISTIREFDARSKGYGGSYSQDELLKELLYRIMH